jgi:hypothetical protein
MLKGNYNELWPQLYCTVDWSYYLKLFSETVPLRTGMCTSTENKYIKILGEISCLYWNFTQRETNWFYINKKKTLFGNINAPNLKCFRIQMQWYGKIQIYISHINYNLLAPDMVQRRRILKLFKMEKLFNNRISTR